MQPLTEASGDATIPRFPLRPQFLPPPASALFPSSPRTPQPSTVRSLQSAGRKEPPARLPSWFSRRALPSPPDTPCPRRQAELPGLETIGVRAHLPASLDPVLPQYAYPYVMNIHNVVPKSKER